MTRFALVMLLPALAFADNYQIDPAHSNASFAVKHMMVSTVRGEFTKVTGKVDLDEADLTHSRIEANIDASTVNTREPKRDAHLKSADFFDVANYPNLTFKSEKITRLEKGHYTMAGQLTIHGITKPVSFDVNGFDEPLKTPWGSQVRGGVATATIHRSEFGLKWNKTLDKAGVMIGDDVKITLDVELVKQTAEHAQR